MIEDCITITIKNSEDGELVNISTDFGECGLNAWEGTPAASVLLAIWEAIKAEGGVETGRE